MTLTVEYAPGIQASSSSDPATQRKAIAAAKANVSIVLSPEQTVSPADLLALPTGRLAQLGINEANLWSLLDDTGDYQMIDPKAADVASKYGTAGCADGTYDRAILTSGKRQIDVREALFSDQYASQRDPNLLAQSLVAAHGQGLRAIMALANGPSVLQQAIADARPSSVPQKNWSALTPGLTSAITQQAPVRFGANLSTLNQILAGSAVAKVGDSGLYVTVLQRYLQVYNPGARPRTSNAFDAVMVDAVKRFQADQNLPQSGTVDRATLTALLAQLPNDDTSPGPLDPRFTIDMDLNQPTHGTDGTWRATKPWNDDEIARFHTFMGAYMRACLDTKEMIDCADLAYESLVTFARQRQLPFVLHGGSTITNDDCPQPQAVSVYVRGQLNAMELSQNTVPVSRDQATAGDLALMDWTQNGDKSFPYQHTFNLVVWNSKNPDETMAIFGDEGDSVRPEVLATFNKQFGVQLNPDDISEHITIDAINADPRDHERQQPQNQWVDIAADCLRAKGLFDGDANKDQLHKAAVALVAIIRNERNLIRNGPTPVKYDSGPDLRSQILGPCLWADGPMLAAAQKSVNAQFHLTLGRSTAHYLSADRPDVSDDMLTVLRTESRDDALVAARKLVVQHGATATNAEVAAQALVDAIAGARQVRQWNYAAFNKNVKR